MGERTAQDAAGCAGEGGARRLRVLLSGLESDAHTWNLIYVERLLRELGHEVVNLGPCVDNDLLVDQCVARHPDLVVLGSVNGHGLVDGRRAIEALRAQPSLRALPAVLGGRLTISGVVDGVERDDLIRAGFSEVFEEDVDAFCAYVARLAAGDACAPEAGHLGATTR